MCLKINVYTNGYKINFLKYINDNSQLQCEENVQINNTSDSEFGVIIIYTPPPP